MKTLPLLLLSIVCASQPLVAAGIMINLRSTSNDPTAAGSVAAPYLALSPAHSAGAVPAAEIGWNNFSTPATAGGLIFSDGTDATGVTLTFGTETTAGSGTIDLGGLTGINTSALYGSGGGTAGQQALMGDGDSIYGNGKNNTNSAVGRAGWLGGGSTAVGSALGLRVDGLAAGDYLIYVMARNTNSNATTAAPMGLYATTGASAATFNFESLAASIQSNITYAAAAPSAYNSFVDGENFVAIQLTLTAGDSIFLASAGSSSAETRGFLNMVQIVPVPEPSGLLLGLVSLLPLLRRRR